MKRIIGLDVGDRRIGVAVSDEGARIATPHSVITRVGFTPDVKRILEIRDQTGADIIVCGLPRNMDGTEGAQARSVRALMERFPQDVQIIFQDERLTTVSAERALIAGGVRREDRRGVVDRVAAAVILQSYLDTIQNKQEENAKMADENKKDLPQGEEEETNYVELTDQDGETTRFEYLMTVEHEGESFVVLMLAEDDECECEECECEECKDEACECEECDCEECEHDDEGEVLILKIDKDENGEDVYVSVDDDEKSNKVFEKFLQLMDEEEEEEE